MKTLTHTITVLVALSLLAAGVASANNTPPTPVLPTTPTPVPALPPTPSPAPAPIQTSVSAVNVNDNMYNLTRSISSLGSRTSSTGTVLVIPSEQTKTEDLLTINEDMSVMSRIFEKNIGQARTSTAYGGMFGSRNDPFSMFVGSRGGIQSLYLQGFGALFLMNVDFPLSPSPDVQDDEKETIQAKDGDPVWQQTRQQMYEPDKVDRRRRTDRPEEQYDAQKVENLKTTLIQALKHAANIRSLKPGESVILTITGSGQATGTTITAVTRSGENQILVQERGGDGNTRTKLVQGTSLDDIGSSSPTILVIRTKKSDIDEFAKGDLDLEKFRKRVQLLTYPLLGGADGYGDPFTPYMRRPRSTGSSSRR